MGAIVFFNIGWMSRYNGSRGKDPISGGGAYVAQHGVGHEMYNFAAYRGRYYGFVQPSSGTSIHIEKIGAAPDADHVDNVTIAWVSKHPSGGLRLVGWYENARVFRYQQAAPSGAKRPVRSAQDQAGYFAVANTSGCVLLEPDLRTLSIPRGHKGAMGQANVWFADSSLGRRTAAKVQAFIQTHNGRTSPPPIKRPGSKGVPRQQDAERKAQVEQAAVHAVRLYYEHQGFQVRDVQRDNLGWDLEATSKRLKLLLEVKGLSGDAPVAELTPNEYAQMRRHSKQYRLCIVSNTLDAERLQVRRFALTGDHWVDQDDGVLEIQERVAARVQLRRPSGR